MDKSKLVKILFICFFMCCIILPNALSFLGIEFYSDENRVLNEKPKFSMQNINDYPNEYTAYYEDNMPFKDFLVRLNAFFHINLLGISPEKAVILGKNGWLFYDSKYKEPYDTLEDYISSGTVSMEELEKCKDVLLAMEAVCKKEDIPFVFMIAPNKMSIYGEQFMPDIYERENAVTKTDILVDYLRENTDLNIVYPKAELLKYKDSINLYYKLDTHWNSLGGYIGYRELYEAVFNEKLPVIEEIDYIPNEIHSGDLAEMLKCDRMTDIRYDIKYKDDISVEKEGAYNDFYCVSDNKQGNKLLMFRDSFAIAMEPYIVRDFSESHLVWNGIIDSGLIQKERPDIVVYELVERSAFTILSSFSSEYTF